MLDKNGEATIINSADIYYGAEDQPKVWQQNLDLQSGTYYIKIHKYGSNTGRYTLKVDCPSLMPSISNIYEVNNKSTEVKGKAESNETVSVKIGTLLYNGTEDKYGNFSIKIPVQKQGTKIYVTAKNNYGYTSKAKQITVIDRIPPSKPSVNAVNSKSKYITGKTEQYANVTAYIGNTKIGSAQADKYGNYKISISPKKYGTKIRVVAKGASGNTSSSVYITVKG